MTEREVRDLLSAAADLDSGDLAPPTAAQFATRRRARRRTAASLTGAVCAVGVVVAASVTLGTMGSDNRAATPAPPVLPGQITAAELARYHWSSLPTPPIPLRSYSTSVWTGRQMIVWGGKSDHILHGDGAAYDPTSRQWQVLPRGPLSPRQDVQSIWTGSEVMIWGGWARHWLSDGALYNPVTKTWRTVPDAPKNINSDARELLWTGTEAVAVSPDRDFAATKIAVAAFNPATNTWHALPDITIPARNNYTEATPAMVGRRLVVWASDSGAWQLNRGGSGWTEVPLAPKQAGCVSQVIPTGSTILFPPSFYSVSCGGDLVIHSGARGVQLNLRTLLARRLPYAKGTDFAATSVWTGAALLTADGTYYAANGHSRSRLTAAWDPASDRWTRLRPAPAPDDGSGSWVWTGKELLGWGRFTRGGQRPLAGLVFGPPNR